MNNQHTVLENMTLLDGKGGCLDDARLVFKDGVITAVGEKPNVTAPSDARRFDLHGKYVLPGLIDTHVHLDMHGMSDSYHENLVEDKLRTIRATRQMANTLRAGITTVRNGGSANYIDIAVKRAVQEELIVGPRIMASGRIICMHTAGNDYFRGLYREANGVDESRKAAREQLKEGADFLKVMATGAIMNPGGIPGAPHLDQDEMRAIVNEGKKTGKHTAAHAHGAQGIKNAISAGVRTIEHGTLADDDALKMMADNGIYMVPTLSSNFWMLYHRDGPNRIPKFMSEKAEEVSKIRVENLRRALEAGVKVVMGTDAGTPFNYHGKNAMEIVHYVQYGMMSPMDAIIASTSLAAEAIDMADKVGSLERGKHADCLVLNANPLENIDCLASREQIHMVFKNGKPVNGKIDTSQWTPSSSLGLH